MAAGARDYGVERPLPSRFAFALPFLVMSLGSCAAKYASLSEADLLERIQTGNATLDCFWGCYYDLDQGKLLIETGSYQQAALEIARSGYDTGESWYLLARATEALGHADAALVYYRRSLTTKNLPLRSRNETLEVESRISALSPEPIAPSPMRSGEGPIGGKPQTSTENSIAPEGSSPSNAERSATPQGPPKSQTATSDLLQAGRLDSSPSSPSTPLPEHPQIPPDASADRLVPPQPENRGSATDSRPYSLRMYELGASLSSVRKLTNPEEPSARLICTDDESEGLTIWSRLMVPSPHRDAGLIKCAYFVYSPSYVRPERKEWREAPMDIAGYRFPVAFHFLPDAQGEPRLMIMHVEAPSSYLEHYKEAFRAKFGEPNIVETPTVQNRMGATFTNEVYTWDTGVSSIVLSKFGIDLDVMTVFYNHYELFLLEKHRLEELAKQNRNKL